MDKLIELLISNWQRKLVAFLTAVVIYFIVWGSLSDETLIANVPIRVINIPPDKTIVGILPNGTLNRRISLTIFGSKSVVDELEPGDLEVLVDASTLQHDDEVLKITRKNLVSLNPNIDVRYNIESVTHPEFVIKLSKLITGKIPITVLPPTGEPPQGYLYLDIWPKRLIQTMTGPEEQIEALASKGLELSFDFSAVSKADLDRIQNSEESAQEDDVSYFLPASLKKIAVPFRNNTYEEINDPEAPQLHIDFLKKELLPIDRYLRTELFFPFKTLSTLNAETLSLNTQVTLKASHGLAYLPLDLYVKDVSRLFLKTVRDQLLISIIAEKGVKELSWGISVIAPDELEDQYISQLISQASHKMNSEIRSFKKREHHLRNRFRTFLRNLTLYTASGKKFDFVANLENNKVTLHTQQIAVDAPP